MGSNVKSGTLYVGNLPLDATRAEVEELCGEVGPIKKCFVLKAKGGGSSYGFVTFALPEDTDTAAAELQGATLRGNALAVSLSTRKQRAREREKRDSAVSGDNEVPKVGLGGPEAKQIETKRVVASTKGASPVHAPTKRPAKKQKAESGEANAKGGQKTAPNKKGRLIVRNMSFKATEESVRKHFAAVGAVTEVKILRKPNGLLVGCGFVQYKHERHAQLAIAKFNAKPFLGRPIVVDWAVEKSRYEAAQSGGNEGKGRKRSAEDDEDDAEDEEDGGEDEDNDDSALVSRGRKNSLSDGDEDESDEEAEEDEEMGSEEGGEDDAEEGSDAESEDDGSEESEDDDDEEDSEAADSGSDEDDTLPDHPQKSEKTKERRGADVSEGSTLFVKNMSFDTEEEALRELFGQFGRLKYAVLCVDPLTEHPRGTAFVQYQSAEEAEKALQAASDPEQAALFTLDDRQIEVLPAVGREEIQRRHQLLKDKALDGKDKRNLYLAREGLVREGSRAAEGVSRPDLNKRVGLEKWKTKMLKNLNMFVSQIRLCIHNIPVEVDDARLRAIFKEHVPDGVITEARVMRDRRDVSQHPRGASKEYGFVTFEQHEHSLAALRNINNNPEVFKPTRRPIVEFAVENRTALEARRKREEKSRQMNPAGAAPATTPAAGDRRKRGRPAPAAAAAGGARGVPAGESRARSAAAAAAPRPAHAGMAADPANKVLPRLKQRPGQQENAKAITRKMLKLGKKSQPRERAGHKKDVVADTVTSTDAKKKNSRREKKKESRARGKEQQEDAKFTSLVDKYRQKLAAPPAASARWFQ